jgi:hypothetical protein
MEEPEMGNNYNYKANETVKRNIIRMTLPIMLYKKLQKKAFDDKASLSETLANIIELVFSKEIYKEASKHFNLKKNDPIKLKNKMIEMQANLTKPQFTVVETVCEKNGFIINKTVKACLLVYYGFVKAKPKTTKPKTSKSKTAKSSIQLQPTTENLNITISVNVGVDTTVSVTTAPSVTKAEHVKKSAAKTEPAKEPVTKAELKEPVMKSEPTEKPYIRVHVNCTLYNRLKKMHKEYTRNNGKMSFSEFIYKLLYSDIGTAYKYKTMPPTTSSSKDGRKVHMSFNMYEDDMKELKSQDIRTRLAKATCY